MTLDNVPAIADNIIKFDGTPGRAAKLNYSVPLPGRLVGRRAVILDLGLTAADWTSAANNAGVNVASAISLKKAAIGVYTFDLAKAVQLWIDHAVAGGVAGDQIDEVQAYRSKLEVDFAPFALPSGSTRRSSAKSARKSPMPEGTPGLMLNPLDLPPPAPGQPPSVQELIKYLAKLKFGMLALPKRRIGGGLVTTATPATTPVTPPATNPQLMLIEIYCISSFLGDYGLGRTVKTFTLLPGESTSISLKTWRSSEQKQADASSIIDSFQQTAASKFRSAVQSETSNRTVTDTKTAGTPGAPTPTSPPFSLESFSIDLFGMFKVNAGGRFGTETHSTRDDFTKSVIDVVHEHANEASSKRENTVTSSSEWSVKSGEETVTERTIKNVNLRRVLNFVFRELNQEYLTKVHLKEIRVAFTNGQPLSYREAPLSGLHKLLTEVLVTAQVDLIAQKILKNIGVVFDVNDVAVPVLEKVTMSVDGQSWTPAPATMTRNDFPPPTEEMFYRFKRGALGQDQRTPNPVEGVLLEEDRVTLRTDSVVVEALLGEADALDQYAMEMQRAEAEAKTLANQREQAAHDVIAAITDSAAQSKAFAEMFKQANPVLKIELVKKDGS